MSDSIAFGGLAYRNRYPTPLPPEPPEPSAAPVISSLNYDQFDIAGGGVSVVITGTGFTGVVGASGVTFGGTNATSYVVDSYSQITAVVPAHAAGAVSLVVTHPSHGPSNAFSIEFWSPVQITGVDLYWDADKDVVLSGADVSTWTDQVNGVVASGGGTGAAIPEQIASAFGTLPAIRFYAGDSQCLYSLRQYTTGHSIFAVTKHTATTQVQLSSYSGATPLTILGDNTNAYSAFGFSKGQIEYNVYETGPAQPRPHLRREGLNDGVARLVGVTHDQASGVIRMYQGDVQVGGKGLSTYDVTYVGFNRIGNGYTVQDGFDGDIGAVVVAEGVISSGDRVKLQKWARQRFGAAASPAAYQPQTDASPLPKLAFLEGDYTDSGAGEWINSGDLTSTWNVVGTAVPDPAAVAGAPDFEFTTDYPLGITGTFTDWSATGAKTFAAVLDVESITQDPGGTFPATSYNAHALIGDAVAYTSIGVVKDGASYYAFMYDWDTTEHYATYDITTMVTDARGGVDPTGANTARLRIIGWKDASDKLWIRVACNGADSGDVTQNDTCAATGAATHVRVGGPTCPDGIQRCAFSWQGDIGSTERDKWITWSA